jgi:hypothetical protein
MLVACWLALARGQSTLYRTVGTIKRKLQACARLQLKLATRNSQLASSQASPVTQANSRKKQQTESTKIIRMKIQWLHA